MIIDEKETKNPREDFTKCLFMFFNSYIKKELRSLFICL